MWYFHTFATRCLQFYNIEFIKNKNEEVEYMKKRYIFIWHALFYNILYAIVGKTR